MSRRDSLDPLIKEVTESLGPWPGPGSGAHAVKLQRQARARRRRRFVLRAAAGVALAASLLLALRIGWPPEPSRAAPHCRLRGGQALSQGAEVGDDKRSLVLDFDGGSELKAARGARLQVKRISAQVVGLRLKRGRLRAAIAKKTARRWTFEAGPYQVVVLGTVFDLGWDRDKGEMSLEVMKGVVRVVGGQAPPGGRLVRAGMRMLADEKGLRTGSSARDAGSEREQGGDAGAILAPDASIVAQDLAPRQVKRRHPKPDRLGVAAMRWCGLARAGDHRAASAAALSVGLSRLLRVLGPADLLLLADTLRLSGEGPAALRALKTIKRRFPGRTEAATSTFRQGRMAFDGRRYQAAIAAFRQFLKMAPRSRHAEGARGRLMLALRHHGEVTRARAAARDYLTQHPRGPYAAAARAILAGVEVPSP